MLGIQNLLGMLLFAELIDNRTHAAAVVPHGQPTAAAGHAGMHHLNCFLCVASNTPAAARPIKCVCVPARRSVCAAVGLSYSTNYHDYNTNDTATASDSHAFLRSFFKRYPHLQQNGFYIAGECCRTVDQPLAMAAVVKCRRQHCKASLAVAQGNRVCRH